MRRATRCTKTTVTRRPLTASSAAALFLVLLAAGCAGKVRPILTSFDATALAAVQTIASTERQLTEAGLLSSASALALRQKLAPVIALGESSTRALIAWQPGQAIPPDLLALSDAMGQLLGDVVKMLPDGSAKSQLLTAVALAQAAWMVVMTVIVKEA
mgnify:FL=1